MDQPFESEVMEQLAAETAFSSSEEFDDFEASEEEPFVDNNGFDEGFEDTFEGEFEDTLKDQSFVELNGGNGTEDSYEFDDFDLWELGAEALDAASAKTRQKRAQIESQRRQRQRKEKKRKEQKRKSKRPKKQPLPTSVSSGSTPPSSTTRTSLFNRLQGEVYANFPRVVMATSDPRTKPVLKTLGAVLGNTPSPTLRTIGQGLVALVNSLPADDFDAMEAMFDWAEEEDAMDEAAPAIAQLTVHQLASHLPTSTRHRLLKSITQATRLLSQRQGVQAARAIPAIVQSVLRTAQRRRIQAQEIPAAVYRTVAQVGVNRSLLNRLSVSHKN